MTKLLANNKKWMLLALLAILIASAGFISFGSNNEVDYSADVKPILNKKCISCHGGVQAKSGFSLLFREDALAKTESGKPAIVPGDPSASEMIRRITHDDPEERMPYQHEPLSKEEIRILKNWIKQGAKWGDHWAYLPVQKQVVPEAADLEIDAFIRAKLEEQDLKPSAPADKPTILRRVSLDLIGIYPEEHISKKFLQSDGSQQAYQSLVDSLLASPRFGERWASVWLDLARYADTKGYESDGHRDIWPYRDWVIRAFNNDMPYDRFLTEQMAGDLLPSPTKDQYIATAFHRNSMTNDEGGTDNEEFRIAAVMDRVNTTWEATMGTTFSCVQCHSHPYDPFRHDEYYKFVAYFNNTRDEDVPGEYPWLRQLETKQEEQLENILAWIKSSEKAVGNRQNSAGAKGPVADPHEDAAAVERMLRFYQPAINSTTAECIKNAVIGGNNYALLVRNNAIAKFKNVDLSNAETMTWQFYSNKKGGILTVRIDSANGPIVVREKVPANEKWQFAEFEVALREGEMEGWRDGRKTGASKKLSVHDIYVSYDNPSLPKAFNDGPDFAIVFNWIAFTPAFPGKGREGYESNKKLYRDLLTAYVPGTPILLENLANLHRTTNLFERGNRMTPGKEVQPAVPNSLQIKGLENLPPNRLGMAKWMTDKRHPLVSRTIVNRLWEQLFGSGIVETLEDMGTQGIAPTHRELLDHLSWKLMHQYNWSLKSMLREMVMSATYRQQSRFVKDDPFNKFYSRGPRTRLSAEQIRDQHLFVSGLIDTTMFGKGVMPWQPDGIWLSPYNGARWEKSSGGDQYRRAIYTYWKRTSPYPSLISFDAAQRVVCNARRIPTNTPLQALVTLNDSAYVDMSRHFARRMQSSGGSAQQQISTGYQWLTFKPLPAEKAKLMMDLYDKSLRTFRANPQATCEMVGIDDEFNNPSAAALVVVAGAMMNLDEVIMKN